MEKTGNRPPLYKLQIITIFTYIISAIALDSTAETTIFSTIFLYLFLAVGALSILLSRTLYINRYEICMLVLLLDVLVMAMVNQSSSISYQTAYWFFTCAVICYITCNLVYKFPDLIIYVLWAYIIGAAVLFTRIVFFYRGIANLMHIASGVGEIRIGGAIANENSIGILMANAFIICWLIILKNKGQAKFEKVLMAALSVAFAVMLLLTGSKKAIAYIVISLVGLFYYYTRKQPLLKKVLLFIVAIALLILLSYCIRDIPIFHTINDRVRSLGDTLIGKGNASQTDQVRLNMISEGFNAFLQSPLFGNGAGYSYRLFGTYSHCNYVELLMNYGLIGFSLYYGPFIALLVYVNRQVKTGDLIAIYFMVYLVLNLILAIGIVDYYERTTQLLIAAAWGYTEKKGKHSMGVKLSEIL